MLPFSFHQLRQLLSESQEQLEAAKTETQKQSKELALVRGDAPLGLICLRAGLLPGLRAAHKPQPRVHLPAGALLLSADMEAGGRHSHLMGTHGTPSLPHSED